MEFGAIKEDGGCTYFWEGADVFENPREEDYEGGRGEMSREVWQQSY